RSHRPPRPTHSPYTTLFRSTSNGHGLSNGTTVVISGALGNTAINGVFPISGVTTNTFNLAGVTANGAYSGGGSWSVVSFNNGSRSEEHTSELQSRFDLVCRL